ncbi:hypothetical protein BVX98_03765 [bacterium F11]|nr:hypothetical protein BVX98_03765 [bacterium F11]
MKNRWISITLIVLLFAYCRLSMGETSTPDPVVLSQERRMKTDAERQAQGICDSIFGKEKSSVLVNLELGLESSQKGGTAFNRTMDSTSGLGDENYILPWVPAPKSVTKEEVPKDASVESQEAKQTVVDVKTVLRRFDITVVHDESLSDARITLCKETLKSAFQRYSKILKLYFQPTAFVHEEGFNPKETVKKNLFTSLTLRNFFLLFLLFLALWLLKFFFGPLANFMKDYIENLREQQKSRVEMENKSQNENDTETEGEESLEGNEGDLTPEQIAELEAQEAAMMEEKFEPFNYILDENVKQLAYLLHHEEPWVVALVISYLSPEHAYKVMEALPADLQAKVALETAMYRQTSLDQVRAINDDIREKIDFVVGGLEKLVGILESSDRFSRDNILEYLKNEKPGLYEKVRERILLFEDIVNFPNVAMQILVRELKTEELGRAIRGASPELQQKFLENMSQGAASLLKEEIEYGRPATNDQIEEERRKILELIKQMEADGKISFRTKEGVSALSGDEIGSETPPLNMNSILAGSTQRKPEEAQEAYQAGLGAMEAGNLEEGIQYLEKCVQSDPEFSDGFQALGTGYYNAGRFEDAVKAFDQYLEKVPNAELQAWVDQVRANLSAAA